MYQAYWLPLPPSQISEFEITERDAPGSNGPHGSGPPSVLSVVHCVCSRYHSQQPTISVKSAKVQRHRVGNACDTLDLSNAFSAAAKASHFHASTAMPSNYTAVPRISLPAACKNVFVVTYNLCIPGFYRTLQCMLPTVVGTVKTSPSLASQLLCEYILRLLVSKSYLGPFKTLDDFIDAAGLKSIVLPSADQAFRSCCDAAVFGIPAVINTLLSDDRRIPVEEWPSQLSPVPCTPHFMWWYMEASHHGVVSLCSDAGTCTHLAGCTAGERELVSVLSSDRFYSFAPRYCFLFAGRLLSHLLASTLSVNELALPNTPMNSDWDDWLSELDTLATNAFSQWDLSLTEHAMLPAYSSIVDAALKLSTGTASHRGRSSALQAALSEVLKQSTTVDIVASLLLNSSVYSYFNMDSGHAGSHRSTAPEENDIESVGQKITLLDALTKKRIVWPVRFRGCTHMQTIDLESWLTYFRSVVQCNQSRIERVDGRRSMSSTRVRCPVCNRTVARSIDDVTLGCIEIDLWMLSVIWETVALEALYDVDSERCSGEEICCDISVMLDGSWKYQERSASTQRRDKHAPPPPSSVEEPQESSTAEKTADMSLVKAEPMVSCSIDLTVDEAPLSQTVVTNVGATSPPVADTFATTIPHEVVDNSPIQPPIPVSQRQWNATGGDGYTNLFARSGSSPPSWNTSASNWSDTGGSRPARMAKSTTNPWSRPPAPERSKPTATSKSGRYFDEWSGGAQSVVPSERGVNVWSLVDRISSTSNPSLAAQTYDTETDGSGWQVTETGESAKPNASPWNLSIERKPGPSSLLWWQRQSDDANRGESDASCGTNTGPNAGAGTSSRGTTTASPWGVPESATHTVHSNHASSASRSQQSSPSQWSTHAAKALETRSLLGSLERRDRQRADTKSTKSRVDPNNADALKNIARTAVSLGSASSRSPGSSLHSSQCARADVTRDEAPAMVSSSHIDNSAAGVQSSVHRKRRKGHSDPEWARKRLAANALDDQIRWLCRQPRDHDVPVRDFVIRIPKL